MCVQSTRHGGHCRKAAHTLSLAVVVTMIGSLSAFADMARDTNVSSVLGGKRFIGAAGPFILQSGLAEAI